jgi:uncharacterized protein YcfJ
MMKQVFAGAALALLAAAPGFAQDGARGGAAAGATTGAVGGAIVGGPVGAVVGGAAGAIAGGAVGSISEQDQAYVRSYVVKHRRQSVSIDGDVRVGATLPREVTFYPVEGNPAFANYRYAWVNDRAVVVEPSSRRVIYVVD